MPMEPTLPTDTPPNSGQVCQWKFCLTSVDTWEQMLADCEEAKESIDFEQFIFAHDEIGKRFCDLLARKAKQGVKIRLLCDTVGSFGMTYAAPLVTMLKEAGVEVRFFAPLNPLKLNFPAWIYRDHKKILVIDELIGYIGGVGIQQSFEGWRDTHVRICDDPIVGDMLDDFNRMWKLADNKKFVPFRRRRYFHRGGFKLVNHAPFHNQKYLYHELLRAISRSRQYLYLTTPYFIPSFKLLRELKRAAKRGVDVRLLLPSVSDMSWVNTASKYYFRILLKGGIKIFLYKNRMIHTKSIVIDDVWCSVGSFNLDNLSFHFNYEANIISIEPAFVADLKKHFLDDQAASKEVVYNAWRNRPWWHKVLEWLTLPFHKFL